MKIQQLSFNFTPSFEKPIRPQINLPWRVVRLSRRYRLPTTQAAIYATEMRLPDREVM